MFINYFAGGQTKGRQEQIYIDAVRAYNDLKSEILASDTLKPNTPTIASGGRKTSLK